MCPREVPDTPLLSQGETDRKCPIIRHHHRLRFRSLQSDRHRQPQPESPAWRPISRTMAEQPANLAVRQLNQRQHLLWLPSQRPSQLWRQSPEVLSRRGGALTVKANMVHPLRPVGMAHVAHTFRLSGVCRPRQSLRRQNCSPPADSWCMLLMALPLGREPKRRKNHQKSRQKSHPKTINDGEGHGDKCRTAN